MNQWWLVYWSIYTSLGLNELMALPELQISLPHPHFDLGDNETDASFTPNSFAIRPYTFQHKLQNWLKRAVLITYFVWYDTSTFLSSFQYVDHVFIQSAVRWYPVQIGSSHQFTSWGQRFQTVQVSLQCVGTRSDPVVLCSHKVQFRSN